MPKPGFSIVTLRTPVYASLLSQAKSRGQSISQYLESALQSERPDGTRTVLGQSQIPSFEPKGREAGRVGFEPTICGSAGRRLGPGSTTGPRRRIHDSPYNGYNGEPNLVRVISPLLAGNNFICRNEYGLVRTCSLARSVRSESFK